MLNSYKILFTVIENGNLVTMMDQEIYHDLDKAYQALYEAKGAILKNIGFFIIEKNNENIHWTIKLINLSEGIVIESFSLKFNQNFNLYGNIQEISISNQ